MFLSAARTATLDIFSGRFDNVVEVTMPNSDDLRRKMLLIPSTSTTLGSTNIGPRTNCLTRSLVFIAWADTAKGHLPKCIDIMLSELNFHSSLDVV